MSLDGIEIKTPKLDTSKDSSNKGLSAAIEQHLMHRESFEEAWARVMAMKNTPKQEEQLLEVMSKMKDGIIKRHPEKINKKFSKTEALDYYKEEEDKEIVRLLEDMVDNTPDNYILVQDELTLLKAVDVLNKEQEIVFDVETTGVDIHNDYLVGHVLSAIEQDVHYYIPTKHDTDEIQLNHDYVIEKLKPVYENPNIAKVAHNGKFDLHILANEGIRVKGDIWDTQEAMKLLNENERTYALKPLVEKYLKIPSKTYGQLFGRKGFNEIDLKTALAYAAKDGEVTNLLKKFQIKHMKEMPNLYKYCKEVEMPLIHIITDMERVGYPLDMDFAEEYGEELSKQIDSLYQEVQKELVNAVNKEGKGEPITEINLNSPSQLKTAIESYIGRTIENTNAKDTLKPLSKEYKLINTLLQYRELQKLYSTYIRNLPELVDKETGRIYTNYNQNGAKTGRFSSGGGGTFNMQNIPGEARKMFVAPEGYKIVGADFSAQEVRIIASLSQEEVLLEAFSQDRDPYATLASRFFNKPYEDCYKNEDGSDTEERVMMKVVLLSSMYGASKYGLSQSLGISVDKAEQFRKNFFKTYPKIDAFIKNTQSFVKRTGFVWIGDEERKRRLPEARNHNPMKEYERRRALRQAPNAIVQGLAAIQTKRTLIELNKACVEREWKLYFTIHDEIAVLMPNDFSEEDLEIFNKIMTDTYTLKGVENKADIEIQEIWTKSFSVKEWFNDTE